MNEIKLPSKEIIPNYDINHLKRLKTNLFPFKSTKESEEFYKKIIEEEMILSNDYTKTNLEKLLNLYIKGINFYKDTEETKKINSFQEKINLLLNNSKAKALLNKEKKRNKINSINILRSKTYKDNMIMYRNKLNKLNLSISQGLKEKEYQKKKLSEINNEFSEIEKKITKTSLFLRDEIKKQSNDFQEKLLKKKTIKQKVKREKKLNNFIIEEENEINNDFNEINNKNDFKNENKQSQINISNSIKEEKDDFNIEKINIKKRLKEKIIKYFNEYNENIYEFYFLNTIKNISDLINKNFSLDIKINDEYQNNIKNLLKMQMDGNDNISEEDINSLKEEQILEIQKNDDLYKYIFHI